MDYSVSWEFSIPRQVLESLEIILGKPLTEVRDRKVEGVSEAQVRLLYSLLENLNVWQGVYVEREGYLLSRNELRSLFKADSLGSSSEVSEESQSAPVLVEDGHDTFKGLFLYKNTDGLRIGVSTSLVLSGFDVVQERYVKFYNEVYRLGLVEPLKSLFEADCGLSYIVFGVSHLELHFEGGASPSFTLSWSDSGDGLFLKTFNHVLKFKDADWTSKVRVHGNADFVIEVGFESPRDLQRWVSRVQKQYDNMLNELRSFYIV